MIDTEDLRKGCRANPFVVVARCWLDVLNNRFARLVYARALLLKSEPSESDLMQEVVCRPSCQR